MPRRRFTFVNPSVVLPWRYVHVSACRFYAFPSSSETPQLPAMPLRVGTGLDINQEYFSDTHSYERLIVAPSP
ncbi:hypothetical protein, partial [Anabaena sp. UHCC 0399]|uniref:hypothetical protein n=1 Tax=Anabaena sp. UHCC 0399 TaxID=3110238 RepID=UPI002B1FEDB7